MLCFLVTPAAAAASRADFLDMSCVVGRKDKSVEAEIKGALQLILLPFSDMNDYRCLLQLYRPESA